jgi:arylsulfatase
LSDISRREFIGGVSASAIHLALGRAASAATQSKPNILFVMTDEQRFDTIAALGNSHIYTPNLDRLVRRGITYTNAYSTCPVCVPARYTIRTGCEPPLTRRFENAVTPPAEGQAATMTGRCGPYLAETMRRLGYRTFGIGKFHTQPVYEELGYDVHLHSEELYSTPEERRTDAYASWIAAKRPEFDFIENLMGERTEMYYMPQMSPTPADAGVESWAADRAIEQIQRASKEQPWFGFVSFIGPHPPFAPPIPFNRMYDPDSLPNPVRGTPENDNVDDTLSAGDYITWANDINDARARVLKARYYGEITYIDHCIGRILDAVDASADAENTLICFFSDHGENLGDHGHWNKSTYFETAAHVPFLLSWPARFPAGQRRHDLACLTDLFAIATGAAGHVETRDGIDQLGVVAGTVSPREYLVGYYSVPGTRFFKMMVRYQDWKYLFFANGGHEQLFNVADDPTEVTNLVSKEANLVAHLRAHATAACKRPGSLEALDKSGLRTFSYDRYPRYRIFQFDRSRGITGFPKRPEDALATFRRT